MKINNIFKILFLAILMMGLSPVSKAQQGKETALEMLGQLGGIHLYNTYIVIGAAGDAFEEGTYEAEYLRQIMNEQINSMESIKEGYDKLLSSGFLTDESDVTFVKDMKTCINLLIKQAKALNAYSDGKSQDDADDFQECRENSWNMVADLLGIED